MSEAEEHGARLERARQKENEIDKFVDLRSRAQTLLINLKDALMPGRDGDGINLFLARLRDTVERDRES